MRARIAKAYPLRRIGTPEDVAPAVLFLASDAAELHHGPDAQRERRLHDDVSGAARAPRSLTGAGALALEAAPPVSSRNDPRRRPQGDASWTSRRSLPRGRRDRPRRSQSPAAAQRHQPGAARDLGRACDASSAIAGVGRRRSPPRAAPSAPAPTSRRCSELSPDPRALERVHALWHRVFNRLRRSPSPSSRGSTASRLPADSSWRSSPTWSWPKSCSPRRPARQFRPRRGRAAASAPASDRSAHGPRS